MVARSVSEEELTGPRQVILQKSAAGESNSGKVVFHSLHLHTEVSCDTKPRKNSMYSGDLNTGLVRNLI